MSRGAWLLIAGVLLLGHSPALAKQSLLIIKKGGVYYISNREQTPANQPGRHTPSLKWLPSTPQARPGSSGDKTSISVTDQSPNLRPRLLKAVALLDSRRSFYAPSDGVPPLSQLRLSKAHDLQVGNASDPQENMWTTPRYLGCLWAKNNGHTPLTIAAPDSSSRQPDRQQNSPPIQGIQTLVRDVCKNFLGNTQLIPAGPDFLANLNLTNYCFPVAPPYTFRDTWGDWRSGGRFHQAVDIVAADGTPVYAITSGVIQTLATWPNAGISLFLRGHDGRVYGYMHLQGYAQGIVPGKPVQTGELIAYVGHTGIKRDAAHLHLQVYADDNMGRDRLVNPYGLLVQLSNGKAVNDWSPPLMARPQIPVAKVVQFRPATLSGSGPGRYQAGKTKIIDVSTWLSNTY